MMPNLDIVAAALVMILAVLGKADSISSGGFTKSGIALHTVSGVVTFTADFPRQLGASPTSVETPFPTILCPQNDTETFHSPYGKGFQVHCDQEPVGSNISWTYTHSYADCMNLCAFNDVCTGFVWIPGTQDSNCYQNNEITSYSPKPGVWAGALVEVDSDATTTAPTSTPTSTSSSTTPLSTPDPNTEVVDCFGSGTGADRVVLTTAIDIFCNVASSNSVLPNGTLGPLQFFGISTWYAQALLVKVWVKVHADCQVDFNKVDCHHILRRQVDECNTKGVNGKQGGFVIDNCASWLVDPQSTGGGSMENTCWPGDLSRCTEYHDGDWCLNENQGCSDANVMAT